MARVDLGRRRLLRGAALGGTGLVLSGCKWLDGLGGFDHPLRVTMERMMDFTFHTHRALLGPDTLAKEFSRADIRQPHRPNGSTLPTDAEYRSLAAAKFEDYRFEVTGLVDKPLSLDLATLTSMPSRTQITRHDCVEGWSCIAEWTGVPLSVVLDQAGVKDSARYVLFRCYDTFQLPLEGAVAYYETIDMFDARHPQTILAYALNGETLPIAYGAPLRVRVERQLGYKMAKFIRGIELIESYDTIGWGRGSFWADLGYTWYAGI